MLKSTYIKVLLDTEMKEMLKKKADERRTTVSEIIRQLVIDYFEN